MLSSTRGILHYPSTILERLLQLRLLDIILFLGRLISLIFLVSTRLFSDLAYAATSSFLERGYGRSF